MSQTLLQNIAKVEALAKSSKWGRLMHNPLKYAQAIIYKSLWYPLSQKELRVNCALFTGKPVSILLPAATDIYLTGGKTHSSEIRLAKFLIQHLNPGDTFWDIGAHYGYFSMLAADLVGSKGTVVSIEASSTTYQILSSNSQQFPQMKAIHKAMAETDKTLTFYELPNRYSEYNTSDISQFEQEPWFAKVKANKVSIDATSMDKLLQVEQKAPQIIKIDVEGGEAAVIQGATNLLQSNAPILVMEYLEPNRNNGPHQEATQMMISMGYETFLIDQEGQLTPISDIDQYLITKGIESENIVFKKAK